MHALAMNNLPFVELLYTTTNATPKVKIIGCTHKWLFILNYGNKPDKAQCVALLYNTNEATLKAGHEWPIFSHTEGQSMWSIMSLLRSVS